MQRCPISIVPAPLVRSADPPVVLLSDSDTQEALSRTQSPRRSPRSMSTSQQVPRVSLALLQAPRAQHVPQTPSVQPPLYPTLPSELPMGSLDASNSSVATLPNTDSVVARTPTLRSQYAVPLVQDTTAETSTLGPLTSEVAKPGLTTVTSSTNVEPPHSAEQDDVESQTSSSSAKASGRNRKAPARYSSPIRLPVKEVEESAASSAM